MSTAPRPENEAPSADPTGAESEVRRSWQARRQLVRIRRAIKRTLAVVIVLTVVVVAVISQTGQGQAFALRSAVDQVQSSLAGQLSIDGIRSGTLLAGATLTGVRLDAADGRPFMTADSIVIRYSLPAALVGASAVRSTTIWGLDLEISKYSSDQAMNITQLLSERNGQTARPGGADRRRALGHVAVREGRVRILTPASDPDAAGVVDGPEGERLRRLTIDALDLDVEDAVVIPGGAVSFEARLASFSADIGLLAEPLVVDQVFGSVTFGERGLRVDDGRYRLPGGLLEGTFAAGPGEPGGRWLVDADLTSAGWVDLGDLAWIDSRIPGGRFRGHAVVHAEDGVHVDVNRLEVELEASQLVFDGGATFRRDMLLRGMSVSASPVTLERLEPWLGVEFPLEGWLSGESTFRGTLQDLEAEGHVTLVARGYSGGPTTADFSGTLHRGAGIGAEAFTLRLDPLNFTVLDAVWPDFPWAGGGAATARLDGDLIDGLGIVADFTHLSSDGLASAARVDGTVWGGTEGEDWSTDMTLEVEPLAVGVLARWLPDLGLRGTTSGVLRLDGPVDAMHMGADLMVDDGRLRADGIFDLRSPASGYRLVLDADSVPLATLSDRIPPETSWNGHLEIGGSGRTVDAVDIVASAFATNSRYGTVRIDDAAMALRLRDGLLTTDSLQARIGGVEVKGRGALGLLAGQTGDAYLDFNAESLGGLRPVLMGIADSVLVQDGLSELDREFLRLQGVEPDTLPREEDVRLDGRMRGVATLRGDVTDLDVSVIAEVFDARYKQNQLDTLLVAVTATGLPATMGIWQVGATGYGIEVGGRRFLQGGVEANVVAQGGRARVELTRLPGELYRAVGDFQLDSLGGSVNLEEASVEIQTRRWALDRPAGLAWDRESLTLDSIEVSRAGQDPMHLTANGTLTRGGESDFRLRLEGLHAEEVLHLAQLDRLAIQGHVDLDVLLEGPAEAPRIQSTFRVDGPTWGVIQLTRVDGSLRYLDRTATFDLRGFDGLRTAVNASGSMPLDLSLDDVEDRVPTGPLDVSIRTDSLDAAVALSYLTSLQDVLGTVSGEIHLGGTTNQPEPEGVLRLADGEWSIEAIGVRHEGLNGEVRLRPDRTVDVDLRARGTGTSNVTGTILLEPVRDPALNLTFDFDRFLAVSRADVEGYITGSFLLTGRYARPVARGTLSVAEGAIYVDELQRAAGVVDLSDPFLFQSGLAVDTTALVSQPLFAGLRNPFFDNLRVDVDLAVPRGSWLRSIDTNVEMSGDLLVRYDRSAGDFVLIGELEAVRGSHRVLGRTFELVGGTIGFFGRPGLNPDLDIQASTRVRRPDDPPLVVNAQVEGTLIQPVVTLTTEEAGLAEEDLISYLIFGQSSGDLGNRQGQALGQFGGTGVVSSAVQGGVTFLGGVLTNQFGSAIARELSLDYVSIQQGGGVGSLGSQTVGDPQLEIGRYIGGDLFAVMVIRPFNATPQDQNTVAGLRVEWALTDDYNVEGFLEDRFLRTGSSLLGTSAGVIENERIWGVFFFREWGYGPRRDP